MPCPLADEEHVEAEVENDADDRGVVDQGREGAVSRIAEVVRGGDHRDQRDEAPDHLGGKDEDRVAECARAEPGW